MTERLPETVTILDGPRRLMAGGRLRSIVLWLMEHPEIVNSPRLESLEFRCTPGKTQVAYPRYQIQGEAIHPPSE